MVHGVLSWPERATSPGPRSRIVAITARASASLIGRQPQFGLPRTACGTSGAGWGAGPSGIRPTGEGHWAGSVAAAISIGSNT